MSTNRFFSSKVKQNFEKFFDKSVITKTGKVSGFIQRKCKKINAYNFVLGFILSCCKGRSTFSEWAFQISMLSGERVSKQGIFDRLHSGAVTFARQLLERVLLQQTAIGFTSSLFADFGKVLLQDSTTLGLPAVLANVFPGNYSHGAYKAVARIQSIFNIKAMRFLDFTLGAFTQNDQSASINILSHLKKDDLVIRDLGYFSIAVFEKIIAAQAHFLSRLKFGVTISDENGKPISLKTLLKQKRGTDRMVYIGKEKKVLVRLVMIPLPAAQVAEKIRKAKQNRDARFNHGSEYYQWLCFNVYVTTVAEQTWTAQQVCQAYKVRWQIEIIFKSWKSGFNLQRVLHEGCTNENRVKVTIFLMLLFMCLFMRKIYAQHKKSIERTIDKKISLLKLSMFVSKNILQVISLPDRSLKMMIALYCSYDNRSDRRNMIDLYQS
jgi:hypothetical protein